MDARDDNHVRGYEVEAQGPDAWARVLARLGHMQCEDGNAALQAATVEALWTFHGNAVVEDE